MAKSASGDKSAAWLPGACGQTQCDQTLHSWTRGLLSRAPWGEAARLAEKVAGVRRQRSLLGGHERKGTFIHSLGEVASPFQGGGRGSRTV